jgi:uncharacterized membrane protein YccC
VISFSAGQAGFTVVVLILFNLIQPSGWKVGIVRVEDVAIGFAVSIGVGLLFWPRGGAALMRHSLARTYASAAEYVVAAVQRLEAGDGPALTEQAARGVTAESLRLDDALRQYLGERSPKRMNMDSVATLVAGARRVQRTAVSVVALCRFAGGFALGEGCARSLDREVMALQSWYTSLGNGLVAANAPPPQHEPDSTGRKRVLECARMAVAGGDGSSVRAGLSLLWASQHLDNLWRLEAHLAPPAAEASQHLGPARVSARARLTRMRRR